MLRNKYSSFKKDKKNFKPELVLLIIIILLIIFGLVLGFIFHTEDEISSYIHQKKQMNFIILGISENEKKEKKIAGCLMVFYHPQYRKIACLAIPKRIQIRKMGSKLQYIPIEDLYNETNISTMIKSFENLLNLNFPFYLTLNNSGFENIIDLLGGVEIFSTGIKDTKKHIFIPSGIQLLDGKKVLEYLTYRAENNSKEDYNQNDRILMIFRGLFRLQEDTIQFFNDTKWILLLKKNIKTNISERSFIVLVNHLLENLNSRNLDFIETIQQDKMYGDTKFIDKNQYVMIPKNQGRWVQEKIQYLLKNMEKPAVTDSKTIITVEILNGTLVNGLASRARRHLLGFGFDVIDFGNADNFDYTKTFIIDRNKAQSYKALRVAKTINCKTIVQDYNLYDKNVDVTVILGKDFDGKYVK